MTKWGRQRREPAWSQEHWKPDVNVSVVHHDQLRRIHSQISDH